AQRQIDELAKLVPDHAELAALREELKSARDGGARDEQVKRLLAQARDAIRAKKFDEAQRFIDDAAKLSPNDADLAAARRELAAARGSTPDATSLDRLLEEARDAILRKDFETARRKLDEAARLSPDDAGLAQLRKQLDEATASTTPPGTRTAVPGVTKSPVDMCRSGSLRFVNATRATPLPSSRYCTTADWKVRQVETDGARLFWRVIFSDGHVNCQCDRTAAASPNDTITPIPGITTTPNHLCAAGTHRMLRTTRTLTRPGRAYCTEADWKVRNVNTDGTNVFWETPFENGAVYCVCRKR
ncbi:MAG: tetratricopeptide repeat protein, partial [Alphaproteobacteria bacterium]